MMENCRRKTTEILSAASVLVITLVRFSWNRQLQRHEKLNTSVHFPFVFPPLTDQTPYDLRAVIQHSGNTPRAGHYTTFVRAHDGDWYYCDDSAPPRPCDHAEVVHAQAYMLVYERR